MKTRNREIFNRILAMTMACAVPFSLYPTTVMAQDNTKASQSYVYGTVNLPYADYYYGELNDVAENAKMDLQAADKVEALRAQGEYDAVSSATTRKYKSFFAATYTQDNEDPTTGGQILGIKDAVIAVPTTLYKEAKEAIAQNKTCNNKLLEIVGNMTQIEEVPAEYKVVNGDGTLTETKDSVPKTIVASGAEETSISITTKSRYGHYQINISSALLPSADDMEGVVLETTDGKKYGMKHLENLWRKTGEVSFAVKDGYVEAHGNPLTYERYADLQGKTISKVTYIVRGGADVEFDTNLLCKTLLESNEGITAQENVIYKDNAEVEMTYTVPQESAYKLTSVKFGSKELTEGTDYTYANKKLTVKQTDATGIGNYTATFQDAKYEDITVSFVLNSTLTQDQIDMKDGKLVITGNNDVTVAQYIAAITSMEIGEKRYSGSIGQAVFKEDGSVNPDAEVTSRGTTTAVFPENGTYTLKVTAPGYPEKTYQVNVEKTVAPTAVPTVAPTAVPTAVPTVVPTAVPTVAPTAVPTAVPTAAPTAVPTTAPTVAPTTAPTAAPTATPTAAPTTAPTVAPTTAPVTEQTAAGNDAVVPVIPQQEVQTAQAVDTGIQKKDKVTVKGNVYEVTSVSSTPTVAFVSTASKKATIAIPSTVKVNGVKCKVTAISAGAFAKNKTVKKITIPSTVTTIGANAFKDCAKLTKIILPSKTVFIGKNAFSGAKNLKTITISAKNVKTIQKDAFKGVSKKTVIKLSAKMNKTQKTALVKKIKKTGISKNVTIK